MIKGVANHFLFYLGTFSFTTDYAIGRITFCIFLLLKRRLLNSSEDAHKSIRPLKTCILEIVTELWSKKVTPLLAALLHQDFEIVKRLLEWKPEDVNSILIDDGSTPLHIAAHIGSEDICNYLLQNGANVNTVGKDGFTPLFYAQTICIATILIENGANVNEIANEFSSPLLNAMQKKI